MKCLPVLDQRGTVLNPPNRFESRSFVADESPAEAVEVRFLDDRSRSILSRNDAPDVGFDVSVNPYRGCSHGCVYCYARPTHEYLGFSAGRDFETRILVKRSAPRLLRRALRRRSWHPQVIGMSGVTDPYQPVERALKLTRACLEVLAEARNPVAVVTKSRLVTRDIDLLGELARHDAAAVTLSITTLRPDVHVKMEPGAASPAQRLAAIRALAQAGIPVGVNVAPVVPGLTDHELPAILAAAAEAGASYASYIVLRLPHGVKELFVDWLERSFPERKEKVLNRVRSLRGGRLYDARYEVRGRGEGPWARHLRDLFRVHTARLGLRRAPSLSTASFRRPAPTHEAQMDLFTPPPARGPADTSPTGGRSTGSW